MYEYAIEPCAEQSNKLKLDYICDLGIVRQEYDYPAIAVEVEELKYCDFQYPSLYPRLPISVSLPENGSRKLKEIVENTDESTDPK